MMEQTRPVKILFYVQHLLGIGHLKRTATLARNMMRAGFDVTVVSGGHEIDVDLGGARLIQLPATRATDLYFKVLVDEDGQQIDDEWRQRRADRLLEIYRDLQPEILITELFPFGRRQMRFELLPLLEAARADRRRPLVISSVRDILVAQKKPGRNDEMLDLARTYFDYVLVHGDPELISLDKTFPHTERIRERIFYTGYVVDHTGVRGGAEAPGAGEVIVSSGGGAVGTNLLKTAMTARALSTAKDRIWRMLVGVTVEAEIFDELCALAPEGVIVERARPDFTTLLMNCALSISQGGYNTVMETLHARCRAVIVPYAGGLETEQTLRARLLAEKGVLQIADEDGLTPEILAARVDDALNGPPARAEIDVNGAAKTIELLKMWTKPD
ncbi:glycosyl transferase [Sneathiella chungangensis]|uniref:Glycosyl transferase n=1 Tax=Sneathiella chungangensis TaxID=1418234 RepID=A0A845MMR2_9PROT|nr:glycosyltransferase [Sneathiella chungangensis]MZR24177.1 glycosyl transferase [Sneathiella chungangensis]